MSEHGPAYEAVDKLCRGCGRQWRGYHWVQAPCASLRQEYVLDGRVLAWCNRCIDEYERRMRSNAEIALKKSRIEKVRRPQRTYTDDEPPF